MMRYETAHMLHNELGEALEAANNVVFRDMVPLAQHLERVATIQNALEIALAALARDYGFYHTH